MREPLVKESKSLWNKLHELEEEKLSVTKAFGGCTNGKRQGLCEAELSAR